MTSQKASVPAPLVFSEGVAKSKKSAFSHWQGQRHIVVGKHCPTLCAMCHLSWGLLFTFPCQTVGVAGASDCSRTRTRSEKKSSRPALSSGAVPPLTGLPVEESILLDGCEGGRAAVGLDSPFTDSCYRSGRGILQVLAPSQLCVAVGGVGGTSPNAWSFLQIRIFLYSQCFSQRRLRKDWAH